MTPDNGSTAMVDKRWPRWVLAVYWGLLFTATHWPLAATMPIAGQVEIADKLLHFSAFALLAWLLAWVWQLHPAYDNWPAMVGVWLLVAIYGGFDELSQPLVGRSCHLLDWLADLMGAAFGLWVYALHAGKRPASRAD